jgi:phosphinothricin acetyltransferase
VTNVIRDATVQDIPALAAIYAHHVLYGFGTFDAVSPTVGEFEAKWQGIVALGLPFLAAEMEGDILGYAYASQFRPRPGYRYTVEDSVYVRDDQRGKGIGSMLLGSLLSRCEAVGARQVVAVIGDSLNAGSIGLHRKFGFDHSGTVRSAGFKHGRWVDIVMMQKPTNGGDRSLPPAKGAWVAP